MKQQISKEEKKFLIESFKADSRPDGRSNLDQRDYIITLGNIPHAFGSSLLTYGENDTQIICSIKAELQKPIQSEPKSGQIRYHLESTQTGSTVFTREDQSESLKSRILHLVSMLYSNIINKQDLMVSEAQYSWFLNVDILVMEELSISLIDYIGLAIRAAFLNLQLPQVFVTTNEQTGKIEVGLLEEIYEDQENTDQLKPLPSIERAPYIVSIGVIRDQIQDSVVLDSTESEIQCMDQIVHIAVDKDMRVHGIEQSRGTGLNNAFIDFNMMQAAKLRQILKPKIQEFENYFSQLTY